MIVQVFLKWTECVYIQTLSYKHSLGAPSLIVTSHAQEPLKRNSIFKCNVLPYSWGIIRKIPAIYNLLQCYTAPILTLLLLINNVQYSTSLLSRFLLFALVALRSVSLLHTRHSVMILVDYTTAGPVCIQQKSESDA